MIPLAAYADRLSVRPGEVIRFHVSNGTDHAVKATLARVICADANPAGPGLQVEPLPANPTSVAEPTFHAVPNGSYGIANVPDDLISEQSFTLTCFVYPTLVGKRQSLMARQVGDDGTGLGISARGRLEGFIGDGGRGSISVHGVRSLTLRHWHLVWLRFDADRRTLSVGDHRIGAPIEVGPSESVATTSVGSDATAFVSAPLLFAATDATSPRDHYNGKLERPTVYGRALTGDELANLVMGTDAQDLLACWDFSQATSSNQIVDVGLSKHHGVVVNTPTRAVTGARWTGRNMHFVQAPAEYGAIHFHDDDLDDCGWPTAFEWEVPEGTRSGIYALTLTAGEAAENVPFHVVPPKGKATAPIAVLASTFTYTVYANHLRPEWATDPAWKAAWQEQSRQWEGYPHNPGDHPEYGHSTYNTHSDGSGIAISSWRRPVFNIRLGYLTYPYPEIRGSGLRHFPADSHLTAWLEKKGFEFDVITDWELHHEGVSLLERYKTVMTGSHPEYHTREMLQALTSYRDQGGRFCYLGGNGFYWKVALSNDKDGVIEIRRGEGGIRAWAAEPGEYYNQFDGEYGGLWRRNGRPPQALTGVGFTAQGNFHGSYYRKQPAANDPRVSWMFAGIPQETLGDHGLSAHGAAGFELDRADKKLGTPTHALVIASSENHPPEAPWILVPEEMLTHITTWPGQAANDLIRADMTFFETPGGGAVFSTGSITFCGSLLTNEGNNDISQLMANVVERFVDPTPFEMPPAEEGS